MPNDDPLDDIVWAGPSPRQRAQLEHEEKIAAIHARSRALVWTGTAEELTATVTRWYESGFLMAESLQDALQKARIHFAKPDGTPVLKAAKGSPEIQTVARFRALDKDYRVVELDGRQYDLTSYESTIIRTLHKAHIERRGSVAIDDILRALRVTSGKMSNWFRGKNKPLKKIILHTGRQHYRLDL